MPTRPDQGPSPVRRLLTIGAIALLPFLPTMLGGCIYDESGPGYSADEHVYVSTAWRPWTVTLIDTRTGEAVWSVDVPVGQQLAIKFRGGGPSDELPDMMDWGLMNAGRWYGAKKNRLPVPGADARLLKPTMRPTPEMPGAVLTRAPEAPDEEFESTPVDEVFETPMPEPVEEAPAPLEDMPESQPEDGADEQPQGEEAPIDLPGGGR